MTSALTARDLTAGHNGTPVVRELTLNVNSGEVIALIGPNGAGKTTTLDTICGLLAPLSGAVHIFGRRVSGLRDATRAGLAYVPESRGLFRDLTVDENLRLRGRARRAVDSAYAQFPVLLALRARRAGLLSGGEQQLLAMACALVLEPKLLLIDEMTMGLAPIVTSELAALVRQIASTGVAVVFVEQHVHLALEMADRAYVLNHGTCVLEGNSRDLLARVEELGAAYFSGDLSVQG